MTRLKKLLIAVGLVLVLLAGIAVLLPAFVDVNDYKQDIEQLVEDNIGRKLRLEGELELNIFPFLQVRTGALALVNPPGFPKPDMLTVDNVDIGIRLLPLLFKKVEVGTIRIEKPSINLTRKSNGETNWAFDAPGKEAGAPPVKDAPGATLAAFAVQGFEIGDANITYADLTSDTLVIAEGLDLSTGPMVPGADFPVQLSSRISASMLTEPLEFELKANARIDNTLSGFTISDIVNTITQAESIYEITIPGVEYDSGSGKLAVSQLSLSTTIENQGQATVSVRQFGFDTNSMLASLENIQADYTGDGIQASIQLPSIEFDAESQHAMLAASSMNISSDQFAAQLQIPETDIDLTQNGIELNRLSGVINMGDFQVSVKISSLSLNTESLAFNADDIQIVTAGSEASATISGNLASMAINFELNTNGFNLKNTLNTLGAELDTGSDTALTRLDLTMTGQYAGKNLAIDDFSGLLDDTSFEGKASVADFSNPVYALELNLGELGIDDYLPNSVNSDSPEPTQAAAAAGAPMALSQFNLDADINVKRLYSSKNTIALENLHFGLIPNGQDLSVTFAALATGESLPEAIEVTLDAGANIDFENQQAKLDGLVLAARGKTISTAATIPNADLRFSPENINLDDIAVKFDIADAHGELHIPNLAYGAGNSTLLARNISGNGNVGDINANILLPNLTLALDSQQLAITELALDLSGAKPVGRLSIPTLDVNLGDLSFKTVSLIFEGQDGRASLELKPVENSKAYAGNVLANNFNLRGMLNRFDIFKNTADETALTRVDFKSPLTFDGNQLKLENIKANIDGASISGSATTALAEPVYRFSLDIGELNADKYLPAPSTEPTGASSTKSVGAPIAIPVELFRDLTVDGDMHFGNFSIAGAEFSDLQIGIVSKDGMLFVSPLESGFFNGRMDGRLGINSTTDKPVLDFEYRLDDVALNPALTSLGITEKLSGNGDFALTLNSSGATDQAMINSTTGNASIEVHDGAITGINIQDILLQGYQAYAELAGKTVNSKYEPADETEFSTMTGSWTINNGIISGNDLNIQAPLFRISGIGKVSLVSQTIDYVLQVKIVKSLEGQGGLSSDKLKGRTIPLRITGNLSAPQFQLDMAQLVQAEIQQKAEEKAQKILEKELGEELEGEGSLQEKLQKKALDKVGEKLLDLFN